MVLHIIVLVEFASIQQLQQLVVAVEAEKAVVQLYSLMMAKNT
jgi:hypothetical protein